MKQFLLLVVLCIEIEKIQVSWADPGQYSSQLAWEMTKIIIIK